MQQKNHFHFSHFLCLIICLSAGYVNSQVLQKSQLNLKQNENFDDLAMLDSGINNYRVFFTGENHVFRKSNYLLQLKMLKYLHQKAGVKHLFLEFGYSRGWLVNQYIQTGDSILFKTLKNYSYPEYAALYKGIYEYNKTLDSNKKITVTGIDLERSSTSAIKVLSMLLPKSDPPKNIAVHVDAIRALGVYSDKRHYMLDDEEVSTGDVYYSGNFYNENLSLRHILNDIDSNSEHYHAYFGDNYIHVLNIIKGIKGEQQRTVYINSRAIQQYIFRENFMYDRMIELLQQFPDEKFYSQFGRCHTPISTDDIWCGYYFYRTLAERLNNASEIDLKNKVLSIACIYPLSTGYERGVTGAGVGPGNINKLLNECKKDELTLFQLGNDSTLLPAFYGKYQYYIVNYNNPTTDREGATAKSNSEYKYPEFQTRLSFDARYTLMTTNLSPMNAALVSGYQFANTRPWIGGEIHFAENREGFFSFSFDKMIPESIPFGFSTTTLNAYVTKMRLGSDLLRSKYLLLTPFFGVGYGRLQILNKTSLPISNSSGIFYYDMSEVKHNNPFFLYELGLGFKFQVSILTIGLEAGAQHDLSGRRWWINGKYNNSSPITSMNGYYFTATAGLNIPSY